MRILRLVPAVAALLLGGCARDPYVATASAAVPSSNWVTSGNWRIERQPDRVTGAPIGSAVLVTRTGSSSGSSFAQPASMQLGCFLGQPVVKFGFANKIGSNLNSFLGYRFDDKPGHEIGARFVQNANAVLIEDKAEVAQFVGELATSQSLYVRIRSLNAWRTSAEFAVHGAPAAIEAALAGCPANPPTVAPPQATPRSRQPGARSKHTAS